jgi:hypothetical protein
MINSVWNSLNAILGGFTVLNNAAGAGRIFELYIMTGIATEMQNRGFEVWLQRSDGTPINPGDANRTFIQRGGAPSDVPSAFDGPNNASVIGMRRSQNHDSWELWNGIQFEGRSGADHEIDIALVPAAVGASLRATATGGAPFGRPRVAIECKDVQATGAPDEMRALVARLYDLSVLFWHQPYLNYPPPTMAIYPESPQNPPFYRAKRTYLVENQSTFNALARRTNFSGGAQQLTGYYGIQAHGAVTLASAGYNGLIAAVGEWNDDQLP